MLRSFVAVDIPQAARDALRDIIGRLQRESVTGIRWARPEGVHITLKFLGNIDPNLVNGILQTMGSAARDIRPFTLALSGLGGFPNSEAPRVIWIGLTGELESLRELQSRIDQELHVSGFFPRENRAFTPHLTIGRARESATREERRRAGDVLARVPLEAEVSWQVEEVKLMKSTLTPSGAVYDLLGSQQL